MAQKQHKAGGRVLRMLPARHGFVCLFVFCLVGNEDLSACKTIAELWDGRLRGGTLVWFAPPEEG